MPVGLVASRRNGTTGIPIFNVRPRAARHFPIHSHGPADKHHDPATFDCPYCRAIIEASSCRPPRSRWAIQHRIPAGLQGHQNSIGDAFVEMVVANKNISAWRSVLFSLDFAPQLVAFLLGLPLRSSSSTASRATRAIALPCCCTCSFERLTNSINWRAASVSRLRRCSSSARRAASAAAFRCTSSSNVRLRFSASRARRSSSAFARASSSTVRRASSSRRLASASCRLRSSSVLWRAAALLGSSALRAISIVSAIFRRQLRRTARRFSSSSR